ncbi:hypothetical protein BGZ57DRAFT_853297 [Hyaloscypha finlandica]|nr:hypothetical protein BGZ57DRAFT_853297 [Hyaloscypha finlandica]
MKTMSLRQGNQGRKKRMDRNWWNDIQAVPIFDPEPQEPDWRRPFGVNTRNEFHPDLSWADSQWSDHATGVGILAIKAGKVTQKTAANFVCSFHGGRKALGDEEEYRLTIPGPRQITSGDSRDGNVR